MDNQQGHFSFRRHTPFISSFWQQLGGPLFVAGFIVLWLVLWGGLSVERLLSLSRERNIKLRETGEQLAKARDNAMRANEAKSEFLARMSHELRTPLNAILGFAQLMEFSKDGLSQDHQEGVDYILSSGKHLLQLVDEVLDIAKVDAGVVLPCIDAVPLKTILDSVVLWIKPLADEKRLRLHCSAGNEVLVRADTQRLKQVLINLLSNAVKYNHDGGEIRIELNYPRSGVVRINVTDTGFGIKDVDQSRVSEPFQRIAKNAAHIQGTGIGLTITKKLILAMGGTIGLQSEYGKGSTFWFELEQIVDGSLGPPGSVTDQQPAVSADAAIMMVGDKKILYIEDNPASARLMEKMIQHIPNCQFILAVNGMQGIQAAQLDPPDLILMDINLPDMDGYQALDVLRRNEGTRNIPVAAVSANAMQADIERAMTMGFFAYLTKPIELEKLRELINGVVQS